MVEIPSNFIFHKDPNLWVEKESGLYPEGVHTFELADSMAWDNENNKTKFIDSRQQIRFVRKDENGVLHPGVTTEQILNMIEHRHIQLNNAFPSSQNEKFLAHIVAARELLADRVRDRVSRGVMGELKK